jgi:hypothetical protein
MIAHVMTTNLFNKEIIKFIESQGFNIEENVSEIIFSGDVEKIVQILTDLRYKYPVGYINGWAE